MENRIEHDLTDHEWPVCLLLFNRLLDGVADGCSVDVLFADADVVSAVRMIVENSPSRIDGIEKEGNRFRVRIVKCAGV